MQPPTCLAIGSHSLAFCDLWRNLNERFAVTVYNQGMTHHTKNAQPFASPRKSDESIRLIEIDESYSGCSWHFHSELQLCHVVRGTGQRLIGDQVCAIEPGEVVLLGSNLPHVWRYDSSDPGDVRAIVVHFDDTVLGADWLQRPELRDVRLLLTRAGQGLQARGRLREMLVEQICGLGEKQGLPRIISLLEMLHLMAESQEMETICSTGYQPVAAQLDVERLRRACDHINEHAHETLDRDTVAKIVHMSGSGFSRFFKAHTGMTFQEFVADVRISRACQLLASSDLSITEIALHCGFPELSTFNRAFRRYRDATPSEYRALLGAVTQ